MKQPAHAALLACLLPSMFAAAADGDAGNPALAVQLDGSARTGYYSASRRLDGARDLLSASLWLKAKAEWPGGAFVARGWAGQVRSADPAEGRGGALLREAYVDLHAGAADLRIGKQIISWGRADEINPTDKLTPRDYTLLTPDGADQRRGLLALKATQRFAWASATAVWTPSSRANTFPIAATPGLSYHVDAVTRAPQWALKIERSGGEVDWSVSYFDGHDPDPDLSIDGAGPAGVALRLRQPPVKVLGVDAATAFGGLSLRAEAAYSFAPASSRGDALARQSQFFAVLGGDWDVADATNLNLQYIVRHVDRYRDPRAIADPTLRAIAVEQAVVSGQLDRFHHGLSFRLVRRWANDTFQAELMGVYSFTYRDVVLRPKLSYALSDRWKATIGADIFRGGRQTYFGRLRDLSLGYAELSFGF